MRSFESGLSYLRQEALKSRFIAASDNDGKLIERLSQVVRRMGPKDAERCDKLTEEGRKAQPREPKAEPEAEVEAEAKPVAKPKVVPQKKQEKKKVESSSNKRAKRKT